MVNSRSKSIVVVHKNSLGRLQQHHMVVDYLSFPDKRFFIGSNVDGVKWRNEFQSAFGIYTTGTSVCCYTHLVVRMIFGIAWSHMSTKFLNRGNNRLEYLYEYAMGKHRARRKYGLEVITASCEDLRDRSRIKLSNREFS